MKRYLYVEDSYAHKKYNIRGFIYRCYIQCRNLGNAKVEGTAGNRNGSCVCTLAMAPARYRLGLALGVMILLVFGLHDAVAQHTVNISGKVVSAIDGAAIEGVTVTNKRTGIHVITDGQGEYRIPARPEDILVYSFVGFRTVEEDISGRERITVTLASADN